MITKIRILCLILILFGDYSGPLWADYKKEQAIIDTIQERGYLIAAILSVDSKPFTFKHSNGSLGGVDIQLARRMANALNVELKIDQSAQTFNDIVNKIERGEADIGLSGISITTHRAEKVNFSKPYVKLRKAFLISRDSFLKKRKKTNESLKEFFGHPNTIIGVMKASAYEFYVRTLFPHAQLKLYSPENMASKALADLKTQKIDAIFEDEYSVYQLLKNKDHGFLKYMAVCLDKSTDPIGVVISRGSGHLLNWVNIFLDVTNFSYTIDDLTGKT